MVCCISYRSSTSKLYKFNAQQLALFLATSSIARLQNPHMSAFAKRVSAVFMHSGAKVNDFMRLNHLDICMSHDQVIHDQVEASKYTIQRCCCGKSRQLVNGFDC